MTVLLAKNAHRPSLVKKGAQRLSFFRLRCGYQPRRSCSLSQSWLGKGVVPRLRAYKLVRFAGERSSTIPELVGNPYTVGSTTEGAIGYEPSSHRGERARISIDPSIRHTTPCNRRPKTHTHLNPSTILEALSLVMLNNRM